jgi:hypothetical protein
MLRLAELARLPAVVKLGFEVYLGHETVDTASTLHTVLQSFSVLKHDSGEPNPSLSKVAIRNCDDVLAPCFLQRGLSVSWGELLNKYLELDKNTIHGMNDRELLPLLGVPLRS